MDYANTKGFTEEGGGGGEGHFVSKKPSLGRVFPSNFAKKL